MSRWIRIPQHLLLCSLMTLSAFLAASPSAAAVPNPGNSSLPTADGIWLVGRSGDGVIDPDGAFTVVCRDAANVPIAGATIRVQFTRDNQLCASQGPSVTAVSCAASGPWLEGVTGADGSWRVSILGCSTGSDGGALFYADGVLLGSKIVTPFDLGGCDGAGANDLGLWLGAFFPIPGCVYSRGDYDANGCMGANDLSIWLQHFQPSTLGCGAAAVCN